MCKLTMFVIHFNVGQITVYYLTILIYGVTRRPIDSEIQ